MKPKHIKEQRKKDVRRLLHRSYELSKIQRNLGYIKLDQPIKDGWYKEIIITHKVELYKNEKYILEVFKILETYVWGKTKDKANLKWQCQTSKFLIYRDLPTISKKQYNKLSYGAQKLCTAFQYYTKCKKLKIRFYIRLPKNAYRIKFTKAYITHRKRIDPVLIRESDFIEKQLLKPELYNFNNAYRKYKDYWNLSRKKQEKLKTKIALRSLKHHNLQAILDETLLWQSH